MQVNQILKADILDIIFENRNKAYGAYDLRKQYRDRVSIALFITIAGIAAIFLAPVVANWLSKAAPVEKPKEKVVTVTTLAPPPPPDVPPPPKVETPPPPKTLVFKPPKLVKEQVMDTMPTNKEIEKKPVISTTTTTGTEIVTAPPPPPDKIVEAPKPDIIYNTYDERPEFPGGDAAFIKYLETHVKYPQQAVDAGAQGIVFISMVVSKDGSLSDIQVIKDNVHYGCGDEAVRVIKGMPPWKPGKMNGVAVKVRYQLPVRFTLR